MDPPPYRPPGVEAEGFTAWWYEFAHRWQLVMASATSGVFGVLLPTLSFWEKRKEAATRAWSVGISVIFINGVALAWDGGLPVWEITLPAFLCSLATHRLLGAEAPPVDEDPLIRKYLPNAIPASPASDQDLSGTWSLSFESTQEEFADDTFTMHVLPFTLPFRALFESVGILILFLVLHFQLPHDMPQRTLLLGMGAPVCLVLNWVWFMRRTRRRLATFTMNKYGLYFPVREVWEMHDDGLTHRCNEIDTEILWPDLHDLKELKSGFHMTFQKTGVVFLPYRVFSDRKQRRQWGARLRLHLVKKAGS